MELTLFEYVYILMEAVRTYCIYRMMRTFFKTSEVKRFQEVLTYVMFFLFIVAMYLFVSIPIVMLFSNIAGLVILSINYEARIKKRVISIAFITIILFVTEALVTVMTGYINFPITQKSHYSSIFGIISLEIVLYAVTVLIRKFKNIRNGVSVPLLYWIGLVSIPTSSIFIIVMLFFATGLSIAQILICDLLLLWMNINAFNLYDSILAYSQVQIDKKMLQQQNIYYEKQLDIMQTAEKSFRSMRHDWNNHISAMRELAVTNDTPALEQYVEEAKQRMKQYEQRIDSGNTVMDSILNFKLREAEQNEIDISIYAKVPNKLNIESFDLIAVTGNLFDNAIQASLMVIPEKRKIRVDIHFKIGILYIIIDNCYNGKITYDENTIVTIKEDKDNHGYGIQNIMRIAEKYGGIFRIEHTEDIFTATVMMLSEGTE